MRKHTWSSRFRRRSAGPNAQQAYMGIMLSSQVRTCKSTFNPMYTRPTLQVAGSGTPTCNQRRQGYPTYPTNSSAPFQVHNQGYRPHINSTYRTAGAALHAHCSDVSYRLPRLHITRNDRAPGIITNRMAGAALCKRCSDVSYRLQVQHTRSDRTAGIRWPELLCTCSDISYRLQAQHTRADRTADIIIHRTTGAAQYTHCSMSSQVTGPLTRADPTLAACRRFVIGYRFLGDVRSVSAPLLSTCMVV